MQVDQVAHHPSSLTQERRYELHVASLKRPSLKILADPLTFFFKFYFATATRARPVHILAASSEKVDADQ